GDLDLASSLPTQKQLGVPLRRGVRRRKGASAEKSDQNVEEKPPTTFYIDPKIFSKQDYVIDGKDVGAAFQTFQQRSAKVINDATAKINIENMDSFL
ncbi:hypothetical protein BGZ49_004317, partial [Haplosporangium sp. Z 27]